MELNWYKSVIALFLILVLIGCSKKETPQGTKQIMIGHWEWTESEVREINFNNSVNNIYLLTPHKLFEFSYSSKGRLHVFQDEFPEGRKYNSYFSYWQPFKGILDPTTCIDSGYIFTLKIQRPFILKKEKSYEINSLEGVITKDTIYIYGEWVPYFDLPHPEPDNNNYSIKAFLVRK